jgi:hypothetical protein
MPGIEESELRSWERELIEWRERVDALGGPSALGAELNALAGEIAGARSGRGIPPGVVRERVQRRLDRLRALYGYLRRGDLEYPAR